MISFFVQVGYWPNAEMKLTLANPGCFHSGIIQHELTHIFGKFNITFRKHFIVKKYSENYYQSENRFNLYLINLIIGFYHEQYRLFKETIMFST